ncbi:TonB-dependent receptor [Pseudohalocynthiibacter aestuariivivens]|uniref:TonB-dependent receptor n=1 Tax=Roseovarius pelagicus TaxID=2980108 RepID=A0ABY6D8G7_9RHOB|nr:MULTISPECIES: TonB-dependent receptor [Rhodobacterales]QIE45692.1 TonB-dependent receptor [Pseudohalocynthiibacter aestuariivivens]UXX82390.1 TonB-dependent receptor [Roseovarius pelagicus]
MRHQTRASLRGTTALCLILTTAAPAVAQDAIPQDGGFLGTILLGESKREVRTDTAVPVTEIDQTEIDDRQAGTVAELIDSVPGVTLVNGATPQGSGITIRGYGTTGSFGTDQKILIQVDGATRGSEELYRIGNQLFTDPALYKEVEVLRGTIGSFEYGSGAVGGVVRLETKDASDFTGGTPGFAYRQTLEFASNGNGLTSSSILAWQPTEKLEFLANYTRRITDPQEDGNGSLINPAGGQTNDPSWLIKGKYTFGDGDNQSLSFTHTETESSQDDVPYDSFGLANFGNVDRSVRSATSILRYNFNPVGNDLVDMTLQYSYADEEINQTAIIPGNPLLDADHRYETTTVTLKNTSLFATGVINHDLTTGVEYIKRKRKDANSAPGGEDNRWAIFAINEMSFGGGWTLTPALRYETSKIKGDTAPNNGSFSHDAMMGGISLRYGWDNGFSVFGSAAYTEVMPIIDDLDNAARIQDSEKSRTFELGFAYEREDAIRAGDSLSFKLNVYDTELWDVTSYVTNTAVFGPPNFVPLDKVNTQGVEIEAAYAMASGFYMDLNANFADGKETTGVGVRQDWRNQAANSLRLTVGQKFANAYDVSWEMVANDAVTTNGVRYSSFVAHNLRATVAPDSGVWKGTEIRFGIENVFDKQYTQNLSTRPAAGRNFKLTFAKQF